MTAARPPATAPYGSWRSKITPSLLVEGAVGLSDVSVVDGRVYWVESRPGEGGRQVLVAMDLDGGEPVEVIPPGFSVRTSVHEYGGRCYTVSASLVVFSNWEDQRLWVIREGWGPVAVTRAPEVVRGERFADPVITPDGRQVICVRETHDPRGRVVNDLVAVATGLPEGEAAPLVLASGRDFYHSPRLSPDGSMLAWLSWDHPDMPWDSAQLSVARYDGDAPSLRAVERVDGGNGVSVTQPRFSPTGTLHYVSDRSGWWNIYDETGRNLCPMDAEFGEPDWVFGNSLYCFDAEGTILATWSAGGRRRVGCVRNGETAETLFPFDEYSSLAWTGRTLVAIAASPATPPVVVHLDVATGEFRVRRASCEVPVGEDDISTPVHVEFPTAGGAVAHALYYQPCNAEFRGPDDDRPPLVVIIHGGPTASASGTFNLRLQYWTNRGFAVADVDYRGSSGYGRAYRDLLKGQWGVADVEDCAAAVSWLGREGLADGARAVIRGGSAGGFTTLAALAFTDSFAAGASHFGIADLELLARDTHKFEARYLDSMIGPWPETADEYRRRSPIHHIEDIDSPLILFHGLEDRSVPPAQSQLIHDALRSRGIPVAYLAFEGEQHGFRKAETIVTVMSAELEFYGRVLGFEPSGVEGTGDRLVIANEGALSPRA